MERRMRRALTLLTAMGLVILLASAMVLLAALGPSGASRAEAQPSESTDQQRATAQTKSGVLNLRYGDPKLGPDGDPHGNQRVEYVLTDGKGQETELQLSEETARPLGGPLTLNGKGIEVEGTQAPGGKFKVEKIRRDKQSDAASAFEADALTGSRPNATILCRFGDSTGVTPHAPSWFDTEVSGASAPSVDHYWREASYNNINLTGSQVFGWFNLPQPRSAYFDAAGNANLNLLAQHCTAAADAQVFFPSYTNINLMFNDNLDCCAWGGGFTLAADGQTRTYGTTWMPPWAYDNQFVLAHETGHSFGLPHSSGPYSTPYDSEWDPMSNGGTCSPPHSVYGCLEDHTISFHKDRLNWIPASRKYTATLASDQNITLERLAMPASASGYLMAQIPIGGSSTQFYTVEARRFAGYDNTGPIPGEAVVIHRVNTTLGDRLAQVVDPDGNNNPNDASAMWLPGETFTDSANGISVKVTGATSSGFTININPSAPSPPNDNFANAQLISNTPSINGTTRGATREINEPDHSTDTDGFSWLGDHSVWYTWTAPFSGSMSIDTCQTNIDSILAVYTGFSLGSLSRVTDNNNNCPSGWGSKVSFNAVAGTTYRIAVGDAGGLRENTFTLALNPSPPANDDFANAQIVSGYSASANGRNLGATLQSGDPAFVDTRGTSHTVWYRWTAPFSGPVEMNTCTSNYDTLLGVYTGSALGSLTEVAGNDDTSGCGTGDRGSKVTFNATNGTTYQILVDGFSGLQGTFTLQVADKTPPKVASVNPANNATGIAPGANVKATFSEPMRRSSVNTATFKLKKAGTTTFLTATVTYDPVTKRATLDPNSNLQSGRTYIATVTSGTQDTAGNSLDQDLSLSGNQNKIWKFKVR